VSTNTDRVSAPLLESEGRLDVARWRDRAYLLAVVGETEGTVRAARAGLAAATDAERSEMRTILLESLCLAGHRDEAEALHSALTAELRFAGRTDEAALEERLGLALYGRSGELDLEALEMEVLRLPQSDVPAVVKARLLTSLARQRIRSGVTEGVRDLLDAALAEISPCENRHAYSNTMLLRIQFERESAKHGSAVEFIDRLLCATSDRGTRLCALIERARVHAFWGEHDEGARLINEAESLALLIVGRSSTGVRVR
jgi:hypothetical protein